MNVDISLNKETEWQQIILSLQSQRKKYFGQSWRGIIMFVGLEYLDCIRLRHDLAEKVIHWELRKKFKFDLTKKWYM